MKLLKILLVAAASCALFACGSDGTSNYSIPVSGAAAINLDGGDSFSNITSAGGHGGNLYIDSYTDVKILKSGTVDVGFSIPSYAYTFGDVKANREHRYRCAARPAKWIRGLMSSICGLSYMDSLCRRRR